MHSRIAPVLSLSLVSASLFAGCNPGVHGSLAEYAGGGQAFVGTDSGGWDSGGAGGGGGEGGEGYPTEWKGNLVYELATYDASKCELELNLDLKFSETPCDQCNLIGMGTIKSSRTMVDGYEGTCGTELDLEWAQSFQTVIMNFNELGSVSVYRPGQSVPFMVHYWALGTWYGNEDPELGLGIHDTYQVLGYFTPN